MPLGEARQGIAQSHYLHVGDLSWQLFHILASHNASDLIRLWYDEDGSLVGFVLAYPDFRMFDLQVHSSFRQSELESEMLVWAQTQIMQLNKNCGAFYTLVNEHDHLRQTGLKARNYEFMGEWLYLQASLSNSLLSPKLASDFRVSDMASFAMCWIDPVSKTGQFEPEGTVPAFQRQGLGQSALIEGMNRMQARGMENVVVIVYSAEEAARQLYHSVGLMPHWKLHLYGKQMPQTSEPAQ